MLGRNKKLERRDKSRKDAKFLGKDCTDAREISIIRKVEQRKLGGTDCGIEGRRGRWSKP